MAVYYNEIEPFAAEWLRKLTKRGLIAPGYVDDRSIAEVKATDLEGYSQCHMFAGIGVWSYALRRADWPDEKTIWTGSPPCQPFSIAGRHAGRSDPRDLWPAWFPLIRKRRPDVVVGEQVASKAGLDWLDRLYDQMEGAGYTVGAVDLCAAGVDSPHIRQRIFWLAYANNTFRRTNDAAGNLLDWYDAERREATGDTRKRRASLGVADPHGQPGEQGRTNTPGRNKRSHAKSWTGPRRHCGDRNRVGEKWDWLTCADGKVRPAKSGVMPLVDGAAARMGRLRGYGNAIQAQVATEFIGAVMDILKVRRAPGNLEVQRSRRSA